MKNVEFKESIKNLKYNDQVKIRYFTYNKNKYIDIIGWVTNNIHTSDPNNYFLTIKFGKILNDTNTLKISLFHVRSDQIIFIKPFSYRSYKIKKIKKNMNSKIKSLYL